MKICFIGKYPPIQGGVSSFNYWMAKALGKRGHDVFVITNAEEGGLEYQEEISPKEAKYLQPPNVRLINTSPLNKNFIPPYNLFVVKLASLAIEIIRKERIVALIGCIYPF